MSQKSSRKRGSKRHDEPNDLLLKSLGERQGTPRRRASRGEHELLTVHRPDREGLRGRALNQIEMELTARDLASPT